jgi:transcriptional regulator with XRE-family HTH domain
MSKRTEIKRLRAQGLTLQEIGRRLGVSRQYVHQQLKRSGQEVTTPGITCCACARKISSWHDSPRDCGPVYCLRCLPDGATFGQRLLAYRMAAKLTQAEIAAQIGVSPATVHFWERDRRQPSPPKIGALATILGAGLNPVRSELARVVAAWPQLPQHIRRAILTLVEGGR